MLDVICDHCESDPMPFFRKLEKLGANFFFWPREANLRLNWCGMANLSVNLCAMVFWSIKEEEDP